MRLAGLILGIVLILLGAVWVLQGANILGGSVMSGQSQWLYIGIVLLVVGVASIWWTSRRRPPL